MRELMAASFGALLGLLGAEKFDMWRTIVAGVLFVLFAIYVLVRERREKREAAQKELQDRDVGPF